MAEPRPSARPWLAYSLLRLLCFAVPLVVLWGLSRNLVLSALIAAVIGLCLSVVLLNEQRGAVAVLLQRREARRRPSTDESAEDRALDEGGQSSASAADSPRP